jgi:hypothetical protein
MSWGIEFPSAERDKPHKPECMKEDSPADKINVTIHEYGNVVMTAPLRDGVVPSNVLEAATTMLGNQTQEIREVLEICGDAEIVENFRIVEGPNVDVLKRFKPLGFYGRFASANYDKLAAHFSCRKEHVPDDLTMEFITQMIGRYVLQEKMHSEYDEEYDDY